VLSVG